MDNWLRPVFTRTKSTLGDPTHNINFLDQDISDIEATENIRSTSRANSFLGFDTPRLPAFPFSSSFTGVTTEQSGINPPLEEEFPLYKPDDTWIAPSVDHMAESLKVVMMKQGSFEPVPIMYNSSILHVLEGYWKLREQVKKQDVVISGLKERAELNEGDFEKTAEEWVEKENDYKAEIKRLEVILSKTEGGLESVSLARGGSVVHGTKKASDAIKRR
jgi:hypothetical protein